MRVKDILEWLDSHAPFRYAASWDRCGLQVGDPQARVERVMVALEPSSASVAEAWQNQCQCLVTHHPLIFQPLVAVRTDELPGSLVAEAVRRNIHCIAAHTNLDAACGGTNDQLVKLLSLDDVRPLEVDPMWEKEEAYCGIGRVGFLSGPVSLGDLVRVVQRALGGVGLRVVGSLDREVRQVALCSGSGASLLHLAIASGCDVYVTGDIKYHEAQGAAEAGLAIIDIGHFASERLVVEPLAAYLRSRADANGTQVKVLAANAERDPFWFVGKSV